MSHDMLSTGFSSGVSDKDQFLGKQIFWNFKLHFPGTDWVMLPIILEIFHYTPILMWLERSLYRSYDSIPNDDASYVAHLLQQQANISGHVVGDLKDCNQ